MAWNMWERITNNAMEMENKRQEIERLEREKLNAAQQFFAQGLSNTAQAYQSAQAQYNQMGQQATLSTSSTSLANSQATINPYNGYIFRYVTGTGSTLAIGPMQSSASPVTSDVIAKLKQVEPRKVVDRVPDMVAPITAWRAWRIIATGNTYNLRAVGQDDIWIPKQRMEARCLAGQGNHADSSVPKFNCTCGFWAFKTVDMLPGVLMDYKSTLVLGSVALWGRVIETSHGYRAQYACPTELWLLDDSLEELGRTYGVPVRTLTAEGAKSAK